MREVLKFADTKVTQIGIIEAFSPTRKLTLFNRLHRELKWKELVPFDILNPGKSMIFM
jgi:hypothetical protein